MEKQQKRIVMFSESATLCSQINDNAKNCDVFVQHYINMGILKISVYHKCRELYGMPFFNYKKENHFGNVHVRLHDEHNNLVGFASLVLRKYINPCIIADYHYHSDNDMFIGFMIQKNATRGCLRINDVKYECFDKNFLKYNFFVTLDI